MTRREVRLWAALAVEVGGSAAAIALAPLAVPPSPAAAAVGAAAAVLLFRVLAGPWPPRTPVRRTRLPLLAAKSAVLLAKSASEEVVWRGLALGTVARAAGLPAGAAVAAAGFAVAHGPTHGRRGFAVHLATGSVFTAACLAATLTAAIVAHCTYNLLVALAAEGERRRAR